jgi:hypothetical protein
VRSIPNQVFYYKRNPILKMIEDEYISLIYSDAVDYPLEEGSIVFNSRTDVEKIKSLQI